MLDSHLDNSVYLIKNFFGEGTTVGVATCLGSVEKARGIIEILEREGIKTTLATCKLGGLTIDSTGKNGKPRTHPGCNPVAQAKIFNRLNVPVVVLVVLTRELEGLFRCGDGLIVKPVGEERPGQGVGAPDTPGATSGARRRPRG